MTKSRSHLEIWARSQSWRLRFPPHHWFYCYITLVVRLDGTVQKYDPIWWKAEMSGLSKFAIQSWIFKTQSKSNHSPKRFKNL